MIAALCHSTYNAFLTIASMLWNAIPLFEGFLYLARFVLDKLIAICTSPSNVDMYFKIMVFFGEMVIICLMLFIIFGFVIFPIWYLVGHIFSKLWNMLTTNN